MPEIGATCAEVVPRQTRRNACWTMNLADRAMRRWKSFVGSVEMFLPREHKKVLTVAIRSRMVQTEASTGQA
jgi:hypothetical protein